MWVFSTRRACSRLSRSGVRSSMGSSARTSDSSRGETTAAIDSIGERPRTTLLSGALSRGDRSLMSVSTRVSSSGGAPVRGVRSATRSSRISRWRSGKPRSGLRSRTPLAISRTEITCPPSVSNSAPRLTPSRFRSSEGVSLGFSGGACSVVGEASTICGRDDVDAGSLSASHPQTSSRTPVTRIPWRMTGRISLFGLMGSGRDVSGKSVFDPLSSSPESGQVATRSRRRADAPGTLSQRGPVDS